MMYKNIIFYAFSHIVDLTLNALWKSLFVYIKIYFFFLMHKTLWPCIQYEKKKLYRGLSSTTIVTKEGKCLVHL